MNKGIIKAFLRLAIAASFLSAVADRFGWWGADVSVWGNWQAFVEYTQYINPWFPASMGNALAIIATVLEVVFASMLLLGLKTQLFAKLSGLLLLSFGLAMMFSSGVKAPLDYSVYTAAAAAFAISTIKEKFWELDSLI